MNDWDPLSEQSMGEISLVKLHGLTHDDMIKAHHLFAATAKKTPYQLDLEVKDRKPDIVPKVGDKVKIKSRDWYEKWKDEEGNIDGIGTHSFLLEMSKYCGKVFKVKNVICSWFALEDASFGWIMPMFEEVYPKESSKVVECTKAFESLGVNASALERQLTAASAIPAINPIQGIGIPTDWSKLASSTETKIVLPRYVEPDIPGIEKRIEELRSILELNKQPELQTIKKHRFIKLENL